MTKLLPFLTVFALSAMMAAQTNIPAGTIIPLRLDTTIDSKKVKPGKAINADVAQDVPLYNGSKIKAFTRVKGEVLSVTPATKSQPATMVLRFNTIDISGKPEPIVAYLRALASNLQVQSAEQGQLVTGFDLSGSTPQPRDQTTYLIGGAFFGGGDAAYRAAGKVYWANEVVGKTVFAGRWGVLIKTTECPGEENSQALNADKRPQALWVFSHDACGVFGYDAVVKHAGQSNPEGDIVLASTKGDLKLYNGSALLLRFVGPDVSPSPAVAK